MPAQGTPSVVVRLLMLTLTSVSAALSCLLSLRSIFGSPVCPPPSGHLPLMPAPFLFTPHHPPTQTGNLRVSFYCSKFLAPQYLDSCSSYGYTSMVSPEPFPILFQPPSGGADWWRVPLHRCLHTTQRAGTGVTEWWEFSQEGVDKSRGRGKGWGTGGKKG